MKPTSTVGAFDRVKHFPDEFLHELPGHGDTAQEFITDVDGFIYADNVYGHCHGKGVISERRSREASGGGNTYLWVGV